MSLSSHEVFKPPKFFKEQFDLSKPTLVKWAKQGHIKCFQLPGGKHMYNLQTVYDYLGLDQEGRMQKEGNSESEGEGEGETNRKRKHKRNLTKDWTNHLGVQYFTGVFKPNSLHPTSIRYTLLYARVSSSQQSDDLQRQAQDLQRLYPQGVLVKDTGSGLNYHRKGFHTLVEQCLSGYVQEVVVTHKDRLCRFGFEFFEWLLAKLNVKLVVLALQATKHAMLQPHQQDSHELVDDFLAISNYYVARNNGLRAQAKRRERQTPESTKEQIHAEEKQSDEIQCFDQGGESDTPAEQEKKKGRKRSIQAHQKESKRGRKEEETRREGEQEEF